MKEVAKELSGQLMVISRRSWKSHWKSQRTGKYPAPHPCSKGGTGHPGLEGFKAGKGK